MYNLGVTDKVTEEEKGMKKMKVMVLNKATNKIITYKNVDTVYTNVYGRFNVEFTKDNEKVCVQIDPFTHNLCVY